MIEILIVIVVLGILAAVVIFALGGISGKTAVAACEADGATVSTAMADFTAQNNGITVSETRLTSVTTTGAGAGSAYIQSWPNNAPHYIFSITAAGVLQVNIGTGAGGNASASVGTLQPYIGPASCVGVT